MYKSLLHFHIYIVGEGTPLISQYFEHVLPVLYNVMFHVHCLAFSMLQVLPEWSFILWS